MSDVPEIFDPCVHLVVEQRPVAPDLMSVTIQVESSPRTIQSIKDGLSALKVQTLEHAAAGRTVFSFFRTKAMQLDFDVLLGDDAKMLVDSRCEYGKRSGTTCKSHTKDERCVDEGATINRCNDRNDFGCAKLCWTWVPPTCP